MIAKRIESTEISPRPASPSPGQKARRDLAQVLWRQRWTILLTLLVCLGAAAVYLIRSVPLYVSASRLYVQQTGPKIMGDSGEGSGGDSRNYLSTQCEVIRSTPVLSAVAELPDVREMKSFAHVDNIVAYLNRFVIAEVDPKNDIITVSFESPYRTEAARVVNAVVDSYITYQSKQKRNTAAEVLKLLEKQKAKDDDELAAQLRKIAQFKQQHPMLSFQGDNKANVVVEALARLSDALTQARLSAIEAQTAYDLATRQRDRKRMIFTNELTGQLRQELRQLENRLAELSRQYGDNYPSVQSLQEAISRVQSELHDAQAEVTDASLEALSAQREIARQKQQEIQRQVDEQEKLAVGLNAATAEYALLDAELQQIQKDSDVIHTRIKELNVTEDAGALNINILDTARPAAKPKPQNARVMGTSLILGAVLGVLFGLLRDSVDQRLEPSAEQVSAALGVQVLGVVPRMAGDLPAQERGRTVFLEPRSETAEAYRTIRTAVHFGLCAHDKTILVTSPCPGDGKTTSASNLAIALAQAGFRTLLLDADFRRPMQDQIFDLDPRPGLNDVIRGRARLREVVRRTEIERLYILPCGSIPPNPSEVLSGQAFSKVMDALMAAFDRIVIDSPPATVVTDACILSAAASATVLVLRADNSTVKTSRHACESLRNVGANLLGIVLNDVRRRKGQYGYNGNGYYSQDQDRDPATAAQANGNGNGGKMRLPGASPAMASDDVAS